MNASATVITNALDLPPLREEMPERNPDQRQQETGRRQRQPLVQLDARLDHAIGIELRIVIGHPIQRNGVDFGIALTVHVVGLGGFQNLLARCAPT